MKKFFAILVVSMFGMPVFSAQNFTLKTTSMTPVNTNVTTNNTNSVKGFADAFGYGINNMLGYSDTIGTVAGAAGVRSTNNSNSYTGTAGATGTYTAPSLEQRSETRISTRSVDPYFIEVDGNRYMFIKDNHDKVFNASDILGINDTKENVFASLKPLDKNGDNRLSGDELTSAGIRIVRLNQNGKLIYKDKSKDFKNSDVVFIYMSGLRKSYQNDQNTGEFGLFDVVVKRPDNTKKIVTGIVTFESEEEVKKYLPNS